MTHQCLFDLNAHTGGVSSVCVCVRVRACVSAYACLRMQCICDAHRYIISVSDMGKKDKGTVAPGTFWDEGTVVRGCMHTQMLLSLPALVQCPPGFIQSTRSETRT